jgi:UDP-N-acetylglucosamine 4-epimerase
MKNLSILKEELKLNPKTWLVTGCAGFIGSNLLEFLLSSEQKVVGLDNFATGFQKNLDQVEAIVGPKLWKNFNFIEGDLRDLETCMIACENVDYILHQGALGSVPRSVKDPKTSNDVNIGGTLNIFVAGRDQKVKRIIFASSSSVYGDNEILPKVEENVGNPLSPYAVTKKVKELYARVFSEQYGIEILAIRYFNVFGPRQNPEGAYAAVIPKWVKALIKNEEVVIFGDGETSRDFTYIENVIALNVLTATHNKPIEPGTIINGALGDTTTLNDLLEVLRSNLVKDYPHLIDFKPRYESFRAGDIRHSMANMNKAQLLFGYSPLVRIHEGVEKALNWYSDNI